MEELRHKFIYCPVTLYLSLSLFLSLWSLKNIYVGHLSRNFAAPSVGTTLSVGLARHVMSYGSFIF
jgi:hypothetical protein